MLYIAVYFSLYTSMTACTCKRKLKLLTMSNPKNKPHELHDDKERTNILFHSQNWEKKTRMTTSIKANSNLCIYLICAPTYILLLDYGNASLINFYPIVQREVWLSFWLPFCLSVWLSVYLSICLSVELSVWLTICP